MRSITLRELQIKGISALEGGAELTLVEGTNASFFLIPVQKGLEQFQGGLLSRALAKCLLLQSGLHAESTGCSALTTEDISVEVRAVRKARAARKAEGPPGPA